MQTMNKMPFPVRRWYKCPAPGHSQASKAAKCGSRKSISSVVSARGASAAIAVTAKKERGRPLSARYSSRLAAGEQTNGERTRLAWLFVADERVLAAVFCRSHALFRIELRREVAFAEVRQHDDDEFAGA